MGEWMDATAWRNIEYCRTDLHADGVAPDGLSVCPVVGRSSGHVAGPAQLKTVVASIKEVNVYSVMQMSKEAEYFPSSSFTQN